MLKSWSTYLSLELWEHLQDNRQRGFNKGGLEGLVVAAPLSVGLLPPLLKPLIAGGHQQDHCGPTWRGRAGLLLPSPSHPNPLPETSGPEAPPGNRSSQVGSLADEGAIMRKGMCAAAFSLGIDK